MNTIWIYEQVETEDYNTQTKVIPFVNEGVAKAFWEKKKKEILETTDTENFTLEDEGNSINIYDAESPCENSWYYSIKEYAVQQEA